MGQGFMHHNALEDLQMRRLARGCLAILADVDRMEFYSLVGRGWIGKVLSRRQPEPLSHISGF